MKTMAPYSSGILVLAMIVPGYAEQKDINRPTIGLGVIDIPQNREVVAAFTRLLKSPSEIRWPGKQGAVVVEVAAGSGAAEEMVMPGDLLIQIGDKKIKSASDAITTIGESKVGDKVRLIFRQPDLSGGRVKWIRKGIQVTVQSYLDLLSRELVTSDDKLSGIAYTWHKATDQGLTSNRVSLKLASKDGKQVPVLQVMHRADTWLFVKSVTFLIDGKKIEFNPEYKAFLHENTHEFCWEWINFVGDPDSPSDPAWQVCHLLQDCKAASVFYHGNQFRDEHELSDDELREIKMLLEYLVYKHQPK